MSINDFYTNATFAFNSPYSETAALNAYDYLKTYSTFDPDIKSLIAAGNILALIGQTNRSLKETNISINAALNSVPHASHTYAASVMSAVKVARDCVKQKCVDASVSASLAAFYGSNNACVYNSVQTAYKTSGLNAAFICAAGSIYMRLFTLMTETRNPDTNNRTVHKFQEYINDTQV